MLEDSPLPEALHLSWWQFWGFSLINRKIMTT